VALAFGGGRCFQVHYENRFRCELGARQKRLRELNNRPLQPIAMESARVPLLRPPPSWPLF
jgi:hypothetical protein